MSVLSERPDGFNFYYGFAKPDMRRIDVRRELQEDKPAFAWRAYVAGEPVGYFGSRDLAEMAAISWLQANPEPLDVEE